MWASPSPCCILLVHLQPQLDHRASMLLMTDLMLLYGSVQKKPHLLLPWLVTNTLATMGLLVYMLLYMAIK